MSKKTDEQTRLELSIEAAALLSVENFGPPTDMWDPDYGWVLVKGEITEAGVAWYKEKYQKGKK